MRCCKQDGEHSFSFKNVTILLGDILDSVFETISFEDVGEFVDIPRTEISNMLEPKKESQIEHCTDQGFKWYEENDPYRGNSDKVFHCFKLCVAD